ncbi:MAG TPA: HAD family hydrolase [Ohtaekwangia sp.]|nr:HAD family hydrolase [Ohtaekwangia sp.]
MMNFSDVKLIVTDIDGTLLNSKHELNSEFYDLFRQLTSRGVLFAAASGRQYYNLLKLFDNIRNDLYFIAENGSYAVYREKDIFVQAMSTAVTKELLRTIDTIPDTYTVLCGKRKAYIAHDTPSFIERLSMYYERYEIVKDLKAVEGDQFLKIAICDLKGAEQHSYPYFINKSQELQVKVSGNIWLDLSHKLANKGVALEVLQKALNISPDQTMVFGDYLNDLEMMDRGTFSYAMENAHPEVKKAARYVTTSNDHEGVIRVLRQVAEVV